MNAPFRIDAAAHQALKVRKADLADARDRAVVERFLRDHPQATPFHRPDWIAAVAGSTHNFAAALLMFRGAELVGYLPLNLIHSPIFGRLLASTGFAVGGGILVAAGEDATPLFAAAEELAQRHSCPAIELRGGELPQDRPGWHIRTESHCGFIRDLADDDEAQLTAIPRK